MIWVEEVELGGLGEAAADLAVLDLLEEVLEVGLELLAALHAAVAEEAAAEQPLALPRHLLPQVLLRQLDLVLRVDTGNLSEALEGTAPALHSEEEMQDALGEVIGFLEEAPHALGQVDGGIVLAVALVDRDAHLQRGHQVLLEVVEY